MPIYEYRCANCGIQKEFLQKVSDPPRTECPECGQQTLSKMVTAAGFQLKGTGWYVTDFRNGSTASTASKADAKSGESKSGESKDTSKGASDAGSADTKSDTGGTTTSAPAAKPDSPAPAA